MTEEPLEEVEGKIVIQETETEEVMQIEMNESAESYIIEYETPPPEALEEAIEKGKKIIITGPETLHYKEVIAYTYLEREVSSEKIKLYWIREENYIEEIQAGKINQTINKTITQAVTGTRQVREEVNITKYDINNNSLIDYVEWVVPNLSSQTYELIIEISGAEHLDENRTFISDIYEEVRELDGNWSEEIPDKDYVRVTFEQNLTRENDITLYPRILAGNPRILVYEENKTEIIAEFTFLLDEEYNKVYLTNLSESENYSQDVFDLRVLGGAIEIDHIIDPTYQITDVSVSGTFDEIVAENNFTHLNISTTFPYDSLEMYYTFDGNNSNKVYDYTGNFDGTIYGNCVNRSYGIYGTDFAGNGTGGGNCDDTIKSDGSSSGFFQSGMDAGDTWTLMAWIYDDDTDFGGIIGGSRNRVGTNNKGWRWYFSGGAQCMMFWGVAAYCSGI